MALPTFLTEAGSPSEPVHADASVTLRPVDGAPSITKIALVTVGQVPGIDEATFVEHAVAGQSRLSGEQGAGSGSRNHPRSISRPLTDAFILGGVRTPLGRYGGALSHVRTDDLLGMTMVAACEHLDVPLERIEDITGGCVNTAHEGMGDIARWGAVGGGLSLLGAGRHRQPVLCLISDRCHQHCPCHPKRRARGWTCISVESMSCSGWAQMRGDAPFSPRGPVLLLDTMWAGAGGPPNPVLLARNAYVEMIKTAQNVADRYGLTRKEIDVFVSAFAPSSCCRAPFWAACSGDPSGRGSRNEETARPDVRARRGYPSRYDCRAVGRPAATAEHHRNDRRKFVGSH